MVISEICAWIQVVVYIYMAIILLKRLTEQEIKHIKHMKRTIQSLKD